MKIKFQGWKLELSVNNKLEDLEDSNLIGVRKLFEIILKALYKYIFR